MMRRASPVSLAQQCFIVEIPSMVAWGFTRKG
jgi:hypothetical protein